MIDYHEAADSLIHSIKAINKLGSLKQFNEYAKGEHAVLSYLRQHDGENIVPSNIGDFCNISTARVATILNGMEDKGLIERAIDKNDRRKILVSLTPDGKKKAHEAKEKMLNNLAGILETMGEKNTQQFIAGMQSFIYAGVKLADQKEKIRRQINNASYT